MVKAGVGLFLAFWTFITLVPTLRWFQTKRFKLIQSRGPTVIYMGHKAIVLAVGHIVSGSISALLCGMVLLDALPNLDLGIPLFFIMNLSLLLSYILTAFVSGT
ncbi:MAG: hypothetical protein IT324_08015 [Anaerolineae bacterium]|nr:hypothetical protein [Anaerolineae bacterium]